MKVFQFYFNPHSFNFLDNLVKNSSLLKWFFKPKDFSFSECFYYSPSIPEENKLGNLFIVGEIQSTSLENKKILSDFAETIKNEYYQISHGQEQNFKNCLEKANDFLKRIEKQPEELSLAVFSLSDELSSFFSKIGDIKIYTLRNGGYFNIGDNASFNSGPSRMFSGIMAGKLEDGDRLVILNKGLFFQFWDNKFFDKLKFFENPKQLKDFFKQKKELMGQFSGAMLFVFVKKKNRILNFTLPRFSFLRKLVPQFPSLKNKTKKGLISLFLLIIVLVLGYLIFK